MTTHELTIEVQTLVGTEPDGIWGPNTAAATLATLQALRGEVLSPEPETAELPDWIDDRSKGNIRTLQKYMQPVAVQFLGAMQVAGIPARITSGMRTDAEQEALYAQGRSIDGQIVTNARAGESNHNYGIAFDITLFDAKGKPIYESPLYARAGTIGKKLGLAWGGDWTSGDEPHFELRPAWAQTLTEKEMITVLRGRRQRGESYA